MSQGFATFILMNNYFHDVATAMLLACCVVLWVLLKNLGEDRDEAVTRYAAALFRGVTIIFWSSVVWIIVSGFLRAATFESFEWYNTTQKHFEAGLFVKYGIAAVMTVVGAFLWKRLSGTMKKRLEE